MVDKSKINWIYRHIFLLLTLAIGVVSIYIFQGFPYRQMLIVVFMAAIYIGWGIIHHLQEGDLHLSVVVEYLLVAILFLVLMKGAIFR